MKIHARRALALMLISGTAHAGGLQRPNGISARGTGMGGAWCAWADDATAIYFNPGALDVVTPQVHVGGELVVGPRSYTPVTADGTRGPAQKATALAPVPALGVVGRFATDGQPSRFTLGLGVWNTFGGRIRYEKTGMPALDATQDLVIEVNAAAAVHISDKLSIGGALRVGIGMFATEATMNPFDADLSATGVGLGMTWGALVRPTEDVRIGLTWRSPLRVETKGSGVVEFGGPPERHDVEHRQNWPQQVALGLGWRAAPGLKLAGEVGWAQWSQIDQISVIFPGGMLPDQIYPVYWRDNWTVRAGGEYALTETTAARAGAYVDTAAVPDATIERQYTDSNKIAYRQVAACARGGGASMPRSTASSRAPARCRTRRAARRASAHYRTRPPATTAGHSSRSSWPSRANFDGLCYHPRGGTCAPSAWL